ncbi:MAG TPA: amino acid ABC transporter permease [Ktedonobacterales bacterium]|nr:amino acid ABC transporter permease [Ktedonobacterales bacterium]
MGSNPVVKFFESILTLNGSYHWGAVWQFLFRTEVLQGVLLTLIMAVLAQLVGSLIGLALYFVRRSRLRVLRGIGQAYVWFFRGTPLLVQIVFLYNFLPIIHVARPLIHTNLFQHLGFVDATPLDAFIAAFIALSFNEGAYMAEIVRAGIDSIDPGQMEAARSLGMTSWQGMRCIVLPQALRVIVPPLGNEFNSMLKSTSLASTIGVFELLEVANAFAFTGNVLEALTAAAIWYLTLTTVWSFIQASIERKLNASNIDPSQLGQGPWLGRVFGNIFVRTRPAGAPVTDVALPVPLDHR